MCYPANILTLCTTRLIFSQPHASLSQICRLLRVLCVSCVSVTCALEYCYMGLLAKCCDHKLVPSTWAHTGRMNKLPTLIKSMCECHLRARILLHLLMSSPEGFALPELPGSSPRRSSGDPAVAGLPQTSSDPTSVEVGSSPVLPTQLRAGTLLHQRGATLPQVLPLSAVADGGLRGEGCLTKHPDSVGRDGRRARGAEGWRAGGAVLAWKREVLAHMQGIWVKYSPRAHTELRAAAPREDGAARWRRRPSVRVGGRFRAVGKHVAAGGCEFTAKSA